MSASRRAARVHALPPLLANQVAAGEVIERPASVLKELLENSLDAGASDIVVDIEEGGRRLIRVRDDGAGIEREDLELALSRHATSKIAAVEDLAAIATMGFRGEALPSIAAVSRLRLASRAAGASEAWSVVVDGAAGAPAARPDAQPQGTTVEVRELFFNTPARRHFLRTPKTEFGHIEDCVRRLALARFDIAFSLRHDRRELWRVAPAEDAAGCRRRLARLLGDDFASSAEELRAEASGLALHGWLLVPREEGRPVARQYLFVNGRPVRDPVLTHAVRQAHGDRLPAGMQPSFVLALELDPRQVDVNVHPAKHEVRFREPRLVHDFVAQAVRRLLEGDASPGAAATNVARPAPSASTVASNNGFAARSTPPRVTASGVREQLAGYAALHPRTAAGGMETTPGDSFAQVVEGEFLVRVEQGRLLVHDLPALRALALRLALSDADGDTALATRPVLVPPSVEVGEHAARAVEEAVTLCDSLRLDLRRMGPTRVAPVELPAALAGGDLEQLTATLALTLLSDEGLTDEERRAHLLDVLCDEVASTRRAAEADELQGLARLAAGEAAADVLELDAATLRVLFVEARRRS